MIHLANARDRNFNDYLRANVSLKFQTLTSDQERLKLVRLLRTQESTHLLTGNDERGSKTGVRSQNPEAGMRRLKPLLQILSFFYSGF
jgi:hypothetical protein